jgi:hypothetical protein
MLKTPVHRLIWFPFLPEQPFLGPLLKIVIVCLGAAGITKGIDILVPVTNITTNSARVLFIIVVLISSLIVVLIGARKEYLFFSSSLFPCSITVFVTFLAITLIVSMRITWSDATVQSSIATFMAFGVIARFVPSGGVDLGKIGIVCRRANRLISVLQKADIGSPVYRNTRTQLSLDSGQLSKAIKEAAPELVSPQRGVEMAKELDDFLERSAMMEDEDYKQEVQDRLILVMKELTLPKERKC